VSLAQNTAKNSTNWTRTGTRSKVEKPDTIIPAMLLWQNHGHRQKAVKVSSLAVEAGITKKAFTSKTPTALIATATASEQYDKDVAIKLDWDEPEPQLD